MSDDPIGVLILELFGPRPSFLGSHDYQQLWRDQASARRLVGREGRLSESGEHPDDLRQMPYWKYLKTAHWETRRRQALADAQDRCFYCGSAEHLDVHHLTYVRRGCELDEDLMVLCRACHADEHEFQDALDEARQRAEAARRKPGE